MTAHLESNHANRANGPFWTIDGAGIGWVIFDDPDRRLNVLTEQVMRRLGTLLEEIRGDIAAGRAQAVVFRSGKRDSFIAGADVEAIMDVESPEEGAEGARLGQALFLEIERLQAPTVAAIHGVCMGGGFELALACRYRLLSDSERTRLALPEVQLGILPAWGGTTRLPRLVGLQAALGLLLTGKTISASSARRMGICEDLLPAELFEDEVRRFTQERIADDRPAAKKARGLLTRLADDSLPGRKVVLRTARARVMKETGGHYPAPLRILDVVEASAGVPVPRALEMEAEAAGELIATRVSKNLLHIFHLRESAKKLSPDIEGPSGEAGAAESRPVTSMGVVGAGVMGGGVAQLAAYNDIRVRVKDIRHEAVSHALQHAQSLFDKAVERRKLNRLDAARRMELVSGGIEYGGFGSMDLVVEAVVERMDVKRTVLAEVEQHLPDEAVLTSNTSTLSIDTMAEALQRPEKFAGMHFFNPVHRMPLVEIVRGSRTDSRTLATIHALALRMGKTPVIVNDGPGFLVNRVLAPYLNEAGHLLAEGASVEAIDSVAREFGMPMGPLRLIDEVGIDVSRHAGDVLYEAFGERFTPSGPLVALGESGRLGRKGGSGFYRYDGGREKGVDPGIYEALGASVPAERIEVPHADIRARLFLQMINEAARALDDGIVASAGEADLAMVMGTGFPPFRGGLFRFVDEEHPRTVVDRFHEFERRVGPRFAPAPLLVRLAADGQCAYDAFPGSARVGATASGDPVPAE